MPTLFLSLLLNRYTIGAAIALGLLIGAYWKGYSTAAGNCHEAALRAQMMAMQRDLHAWQAADDANKEQQAKLAAENAQLEQQVADYEKSIATRPDNRCNLSTGDIDRLRGIGGR